MPEDSSGRFASAVEPWLSAHAQAQAQKTDGGRKPGRGYQEASPACADTKQQKGASCSAAAASEEVQGGAGNSDGVLLPVGRDQFSTGV